jgi:hypothetical protein
MKNFLAILTLLLASAQPCEANEAPLKPKMQLQLAVPPVWDPISRTFYLPEMVMVKQADSLDNCSFYGGPVTIRKIDGDNVFFETKGRSKPLDYCNHLVTTRENIHAWDINLVEEQKKTYSRESTAFRQQLNADVKEILDKKRSCTPDGAPLAIGSHYRLDGEVFWHGTNTAALTVEEADSCHVEKNSNLELLGYDRTADFILAVYHQPASHVEKVEIVDIQQKHKQKRTCRDGEKIVLALKKVSSQFHLNPDERGIFGKLASFFKGSGAKTCGTH